MKYRILRTAVGSPVAPFIIKELQSEGYFILGVDVDPLSCGFYFANERALVPRVSDQNYISVLIKLCKEHHIDIFWPDLDEELTLVAQHRQEFENIGVKVLLNDIHPLKICTDKWETYKCLQEAKIPVPFSWDLDSENIESITEFPVLLKPKFGRGSQGINIVDSSELLLEKNIKGYIAQQYLDGKEYTVDVMSNFKGEYIYSSIRERIATDSGISIKGKTVSDSKISMLTKRAANILQLKGPTCFQCIVTNDQRIGFIEINPRIAGTVALSVMAGAPIITDSVKALMGEEIVEPMNYNSNLTMARYWEQTIVS